MAYRPPFVDPAFKMVEAPHPATIDEEILARDCEILTGRVGGPGGQHRNRVDTAVWVMHTPTGIEAQASERRSQIENKRMAMRRLRRKLASHGSLTAGSHGTAFRCGSYLFEFPPGGGVVHYQNWRSVNLYR